MNDFVTIKINIHKDVIAALKKDHDNLFAGHKAETGRDPPQYDDEWLLDDVEDALEKGLEEILGRRNVSNLSTKIKGEVVTDIGLGELEKIG